MADLKTRPTNDDVVDFLNRIEDDQKKNDAFRLLDIMKDVTEETPKMWGGNIVGFGTYHYKYESGREGDWFLTGFSPRKSQFSIYIMAGFDNYDNLLAQLGKFKTGVSCLYVKKLSDIDEKILRELIKESVAYMKQRY